MKKPKYIESIYRYLFLIIGLVFWGLAVLVFIGVLTPSSKSGIQNQSHFAYVFIAITFISSILSNVFYIIATKKERDKQLIIEEGVFIDAVVEDVYIIKSIHFIKQSPYRIKYSYMIDGNKVTKKSNLLWDNPNVEIGQLMKVLVLNNKSLLKIEI